ncbi:centrosomal protein of 78 kDa-like [Diorhabda sublineata]|uniref:centrosomal protein of 78 kDa-like n=1 Tax=Diorhabda sublineata TaxID=1163346 RepID=UPI0024E062ED|nr:centrosomal protein of 78 kDa-like [Diorhabda sublineata]
MDSSQLSLKLHPKPINIFYVWYPELCRRMNCIPARVIKLSKPKCRTILEFNGDRLKIDEWIPIVNALRTDTSLHAICIKSRLSNCPVLHDIETEEKAKNMKRRYGSLYTAFVLSQLVKSISSSIKRTDVLTFLELDGLPMLPQYLEPLMQALKKNKSVRHLSFANCALRDSGCDMVCQYLRYIPNIEVINLSGCNLCSKSGEYLSKFIKYQQINRYCESWHNSLRYENPQKNNMKGIKRITINCNDDFGDKGCQYILDELEDDLWIKALDLQRCGITEDLAIKIIDIVRCSKSLEIFDLRQNDQINIKTIEKIRQVLEEKQEFGYQPEFQWCSSSLSLTPSASTISKLSVSTPVHKTKSAPIKMNCRQMNGIQLDMVPRKSKTLETVSKREVGATIISDLNLKIQSEIQKRKLLEKKNEELQQQLNKLQSTIKFAPQQGKCPKKPLKIVVESVDRKAKNSKPLTKSAVQKEVRDKKNEIVPLNNNTKRGFIKNNEYRTECVKNGYKHENVPNGCSSEVINNASKIFQNMLMSDSFVDSSNDSTDLLEYITNDKSLKNETGNVSEVSTESLQTIYQFIAELENNSGKYKTKERQQNIGKK